MTSRTVPGARPAQRRPGAPGQRAVRTPDYRRDVVDHSLARRAILVRLARGAVAMSEVCDADPYLVRSARFHGEHTDQRCPVCRRCELDLVSYVFGDELGQFSGRLRSRQEIVDMSGVVGDVSVYVVEVCQGCRWNHLDVTFRIGDGVARRPPRRQRTAEDDYP